LAVYSLKLCFWRVPGEQRQAIFIQGPEPLPRFCLTAKSVPRAYLQGGETQRVVKWKQNIWGYQARG